MGTISDKLIRIINTKEDIRQALISKGYDVPTSIPFKEYAKMISDLPCIVDSFPDIEGIVARYSALGLTNEQMAANPVWVDKTGNGHDLQMKNFFWGGMSGVGGYNQNFNQYFVGVDESNKTVSDSSMKLVLLESDSQKVIYDRNSYQIGHTYNFYIKVTGIEGRMLNVNAGTLGGIIMSITEDGIYSINVTVSDRWGQNRLYLIFPPSSSSNTITIEQLPLYPGALVFDGVDDYGVCDNFPILTKEKGYTVVALRQWITRGEIAQGLVSNVKNWLKDGAFLLEYRNIQADHLNKPISFGAIGSENDLPHILTYQTSKSYNGVSITTGNFEGTDVLYVGKLAPTKVGTCINAAIWELVFLDHDATEEELTKIKDYFVKTYPWLFPDQAWTVVGKTNEDEDRATIANITGNGNDLLLSNFGFAQGSGYGLYYQYFGNEFKATNGEIEGGGWNIIDNYNISHDKRIPINSIGKCFWGNKALVNGIKLRFKLTGMTEGDVLAFGYAATYDLTYTSDGIYAIDLPPVDKSYGFSLQSSLTENLPTTPVTIELLPFEYEGYLVTDGVDDKVISAESIAFTDTWTIITDTVFLGKVSVASGILASNIFTVYNYQGSGTIAVVMGDGGSLLRVITSSIKAFSSDGTIYDAEWNEYHVEIGIIRALERLLKIGTSSNETSYFCQLAFKFLGIYNNQILSKDDCIKAYNYLQTLKAK